MATSNWEVVANRLILVNTKWEYWKQLFAEEDDVNLLNFLSPSCFALIQESMLLDVIGSIARLLDNKKAMGRDNLVIETLIDEVPAPHNSTFKGTLDNLKTASEAIKKIRHKVIAHEDLDIATGTAQPLPPTDLAEIDKVLSEMNSLVHGLESAAGKHTHVFSAVDVRGSGRTLHWLLKSSQKAALEARSAAKAGKGQPIPDDDKLAMIPVRQGRWPDPCP